MTQVKLSLISSHSFKKYYSNPYFKSTFWTTMSIYDSNVEDQNDNFDELVGSMPSEIKMKTETAKNGKVVNLILDPSTFTRGIGNIKRWYNEEYVEQKKKKQKNIHTTVNLYIPRFTLNEFKYLKRGTTMIAVYAQQSIKFIDDIFDRNNISKDITKNFHINLSIEGPNESGPPWPLCERNQIYRPRIKDFPNFKTKFDSTTMGKNYKDSFLDGFGIRSYEKEQPNDIQYENSESYMTAAANADNFATMPARLKYLIRSCIFKRFIQQQETEDRTEEWKLVSEEPITQIWARSFGIDSINVNEAELLMFQSYDVNEVYNPHTSFNVDDALSHDSVIQETIDTSLYTYSSLGNARKGNVKSSKDNNKQRKVKGISTEVISQVNGEVVKHEDFDSINYAPRGKGKLWKPT